MVRIRCVGCGKWITIPTPYELTRHCCRCAIRLAYKEVE